MKFKIDENLPTLIQSFFLQAEHNVRTVRSALQDVHQKEFMDRGIRSHPHPPRGKGEIVSVLD